MDKIIFLDFDGVLSVSLQERDKYGQLFHQRFVDNLKYVIDKTNAKLVIISSWRTDGIDVMQNMWKDRNLPGEIVGNTPYCAKLETCRKYRENQERGLEIQEYIDENNIDSYVIIDDDDNMLSQQIPFFVNTSSLIDEDSEYGYGLTKFCAEKAIQILLK